MIFKQVYTNSQTDLAIITPASGKKIYVWEAVIESESSGEVEFLTSVIKVVSTDSSSRNKVGVHKEGAVDEVLSLTCGANTTVRILYEEI
jgi:hypothetical protein